LGQSNGLGNDSIENHTWDIVDLLEGKDCIGVKWIYKTKINGKGEIEKYKAILVEIVFTQQHGVAYGETFAALARLDTVRVFIMRATQKRLKVY